MEQKQEAKKEQHEAPRTADEQKAKEHKSKAKKAVKAATVALHAIRPQPRATEIEDILDQIRAMEEPPADDKAAAAKAEELYKKPADAGQKAA